MTDFILKLYCKITQCQDRPLLDHCNGGRYTRDPPNVIIFCIFSLQHTFCRKCVMLRGTAGKLWLSIGFTLCVEFCTDVNSHGTWSHWCNMQICTILWNIPLSSFTCQIILHTLDQENNYLTFGHSRMVPDCYP